MIQAVLGNGTFKTFCRNYLCRIICSASARQNGGRWLKWWLYNSFGGPWMKWIIWILFSQISDRHGTEMALILLLYDFLNGRMVVLHASLPYLISQWLSIPATMVSFWTDKWLGVGGWHHVGLVHLFSMGSVLVVVREDRSCLLLSAMWDAAGVTAVSSPIQHLHELLGDLICHQGLRYDQYVYRQYTWWINQCSVHPMPILGAVKVWMENNRLQLNPGKIGFWDTGVALPKQVLCTTCRLTWTHNSCSRSR